MFGVRTQGFVFGILAAVCYGLNPLGAKSLYAGGLTADSVLFYRYAIAAAALGAWLVLRGETFRLAGRELRWVAILGACFGVSSLTFFESFTVMDSGLACALLFVYPAMVAGIMAACFGERLGVWRMAALAGGLGGVALLCRGGGGGVSALGVALVMVSALTYALYIVFLNRARLELSVAKLTFYALLFGLPFILGHEALGGRFVPQPLVSPGMALWALMLGFVPTVLSLVLMAEAVRRVGETPTALLGALEPLTALAIGFLFFGEALTVRATLGVALILGAVALITLLPAAPKCHRRRA